MVDDSGHVSKPGQPNLMMNGNAIESIIDKVLSGKLRAPTRIPWDLREMMNIHIQGLKSKQRRIRP